MSLNSQLGWAFISVGSFVVSWIISYGIVQSIAPTIYGKKVGRLIDTVLSARIYQTFGLQACLRLCCVFLCAASLISVFLSKHRLKSTT